MASELIKAHKDTAEVYHGEAVCNKKMREILECNGIPSGVLPVAVTELGHDKAAQFVWVKQKEKTEKKNVHVNKVGSYDAEITFFLEKNRVKKAIGIKSKVLMSWVVISNIYIDEIAPDKIVFETPKGFSLKLPRSAFVTDEEAKGSDLNDTK